MMDPVYIGIIGFAVMLLLLLLKVHIAISMGLVGLAGALLLLGEAGFGLARITPYGTAGSYELSVLPLFILMGMFAAESGIAISLYEAAQKWLGWLRGGLLFATTISIGLFGACCGSSVAAATTFTKIALPELIKHKYDAGISGGAIAAGGTQAALIPPSALLIFYGILTEQSIGKLLLAGIIPGFISIVIYFLAVSLTLKIYPEKAPGKMTFSNRQRIHSLKGIWPIPIIFISILGGLYLGIFTPTEAGAVGALLTLVVGIFNVGWKKFPVTEAILSTIKTTAMTFAILVSAMIFVRFVAITQLPTIFGDAISHLNLPAIMILIIFLFIYLILGCFLDAVGMVALTIPIVYPIIEMLGIDGVWFGILLVKIVEIGLISPPIGINVFVVKGAAGDQVSTMQLFKGILPFLAADFLTMIILILFPILTLWIPNHLS